jgi:LuxR family maltose regulon positive regulatory protein
MGVRSMKTSEQAMRPPGAVDRPALIARMRGTVSTKLVMLCSAAGYGKTSVMAQLHEVLRAEGQDCHWLTLDEADNDPGVLLNRLDTLTDACVHASPVARPTIMLDELEVLANPASVSLIQRLVERAGPSWLVVIATRHMPGFGISRLRARGHLVELCSDDLRFTQEESRAFFDRQDGLDLLPCQVESLHRKTGGWPAALRLAQASLARHADAETLIANFSGASDCIADYFVEDIFGHQPLSMQHFLLRTCILDELDPDLCDALIGEPVSHEHLEALIRANVFLESGVPGEPRSYQPLFQEFLRARLWRLRPAWHRDGHLAASAWYLDRQDVLRAIGHAVDAGSIEHAVPLLDKHASMLLRSGHPRQLVNWLDRIPRALLEQHPRLRVLHIWTVKLVRGASEALSLTERFDPSTVLDSESEASLRALRPMLLGLMDRIDDARALAARNLEEIGPEHAFAHAMLHQTMASTSLIKGDLSDARRHVDLARSQAIDSPFQLALVGSTEGSMHLMQGRLQEALVRLRSAVSGERSGDGEYRRRFALPSTLQAFALHESGNEEHALQVLPGLLELLRDLGIADELIVAHALVARLWSSRGDIEGSLRVLDDLETTGRRLGLARVVASARLERARGLTDRGRFEAARDEIEHAGDDRLWVHASERWYLANDLCTRDIARARWLVRSGKPTQAASLLTRLLDAAEQAGRVRRALTLRTLLAEAKYREGMEQAAHRIFQDAVALARSEGYVNVFRDEGALVQRLLDEVETRTDQDVVAQPRTHSHLIVEQLTHREGKVLSLLAEGNSNDSIAAQLFVSRSTIRTHLRNINVKLNASSRTHAVAIARQLQLVS